jgi:ATP-dependent Clp protease ATP-binding subunit ClpC
MFQRFTDRARRVVVLAREEARGLGHDHVGTEHILLGIITEGQGVASKTLDELGISPDAVRQQVEERIGRGEHEPDGNIPFTPRAKRVLELSLREAQQLGHDYIGTEHILLGLIREGDGEAAQVLIGMGADLARARVEVARLLGIHMAGSAVTPELRAAGAGRLRQIEVRLESIEAKVDAIEARFDIVLDEPGPRSDPGPESSRTAD